MAESIEMVCLRAGKSSRARLRSQWFSRWHPLIDVALAALPENEDCPGELYRELLCNQSPRKKRIVILWDGGEPAAVVGLRRSGLGWDLLSNWILPGEGFPVAPGRKLDAIEGLNVNVHVVEWRCGGPPPANGPMVRQLNVEPTYRMPCSEDFEQYWRKMGHWNTVRRMAKRCRDFQFQVNAPGSAEWTIRLWEAAWRVDAKRESPTLADRLLAARYLEKTGKHLTFSLAHDGELIAGHTFLVHRNDLVWQITHRDLAYDHFGVGTRLMELIFHWAKENGFDQIDLGGGHDYKARWAPAAGEKYEYQACPDTLYLAERLAHLPLWMVSHAGLFYHQVFG